MDVVISIFADIVHIIKVLIICKYYLALEERINNRHRYIMSIIITMFVSLYISFSESVLMVFFIYILSVLGIICFCYSERLHKLIISGIWIIMIIEVVNMMFMLMVQTSYTILDKNELKGSNLIAEIGALLFVSILCIMLRKVDKNCLRNISANYLVMISVIMVADLLVMYTMIATTSDEITLKRRVVYTVAFVFVALGMLIQIAAILLLVVSRNEHKEKQIIINQYLEDQVNYYEYLNEKEKQTKKFRHDIRNHLYLLNKLKQEGNNKEFDSYFDDIVICINELDNKVEVGNDIVNALLNKAYSEAESKGIIMEVRGHFPNRCEISAYDLCTIFFNLLSNAIEAAKVADIPKIWVVCQYTSKEIIIEIGNYYSGNIKILNDKIYTQKTQKDYHGWGLENVRDSVNKCNGLMDIEYKNNKFVVSITLQYKKGNV